jgi:hypothetical protein
MTAYGTESFDKDRAIVDAMRVLGEPEEAVEEFLACLGLSDAECDRLRQVMPRQDMTTGDVIAMNPLTAQPQRSKPRS